MQKVIAVIGYNNTRIGDVRKIRAVARRFGAKVLLVKKQPTPQERSAADFVADVDLDDHLTGVTACQAAADAQGLQVIAVLPFSDRGVVIGAQWAKFLRLLGSDPERTHVGLDKWAFRMAEARCRKLPSWYYRPSCGEVATPQNILAYLRRATRFGQGIYVKPKKEGNSRGGTHVTDEVSAEEAFRAVLPYLREGAVAEEYMPGVASSFGSEFSYDRVGSMTWVTAKETTPGRYRAEIQQIVPAPLPPKDYERLCHGGELIADFCGTGGGSACHIEEMLLAPAANPDEPSPGPEHDVGAVEPNLRPAGMKIWDLAEVAFGRSPWEEWLAWGVGLPPTRTSSHRVCFAGIRMIAAPRTCVFSGVPEAALACARTRFPEVFEIDITHPPGKLIPAEARDNAEFVGQVLAKHQDPERLQTILRDATDFLSQQVRIQE